MLLGKRGGFIMSTNAVVKVVSSANLEGTSKIGKKIKNVASNATVIGQMLQGKGFVEAQVDATKAQAHYAKEAAKSVYKAWYESSPLCRLIDWIKN